MKRAVLASASRLTLEEPDMPLRTEIRAIDPAQAAELIRHRGHQRPTSLRTVTRYARDMAEGRWHLSGASISLWLDSQGEWGEPGITYVLNGRHRLLALIEAEITIEFLVVHEQDPGVFQSFDSNLVRTPGTLIALLAQEQGHEPKNGHAIGAIAGHVLRYQLDRHAMWTQDQLSKGEILEWVANQDWSSLTQAAHDYSTLRRQSKLLGFWYGALSYMVNTESQYQDMWIPFHEALVHGNELKGDDARLVLRNYLVRNQPKKGDYWQRQTHLAIGIKTWNGYVTGTSKKLLIFQESELTRSGMPVIL